MATIIIGILAITVVVLLSRKTKRSTTPHPPFDRIRDLGELCVLQVHATEYVSVKSKQAVHVKDGSATVLCSFDLEFRYDLRALQIQGTGQPNSYRLTLPPYTCKFIPDRVAITDETKPKWLFILPLNFSLEERNQIIAEGLAVAAEQAKNRYAELQKKIEESAAKTLRAMSKAFGATEIELNFTAPEVGIEQVTKEMQRMLLAA